MATRARTRRQLEDEESLDRGSAAQTIATVERAADVLALFSGSASSTLGVTEIATELALSKAAVHRILASLRSRGFVELEEDSRRYSLGTASLALGLAYLRGIDVRAIAHPELVALSESTSETATLSIRNGDTRVYVDQVRPPREIVMSVALGVPYPLHAGSSSKAFLAFLDDAELEAYLSGPLRKLTDRTIIDPAALRAEVTTIRRGGYAVSFGERQAGAASVAAPVFDHSGRVVAVVSACGPLERFQDEVDDCVPQLLEATARISARMGHAPERG